MRIQFRITKTESLEKWQMAQEWFNAVGYNKVAKTKNAWLEDLFIRAIDDQVLDNIYASRVEEVIEDKMDKLSNKSFNRLSGYTDRRMLPMYKTLIILQKQMNFLVSSLVSSGIVDEDTFVEPHEQQIADPPFVKAWKDELDSKFSNYKSEEIVKQYFGAYEETEDNQISRELLKKFIKYSTELGIKSKTNNLYKPTNDEFNLIGKQLINEFEKYKAKEGAK
ncbi:hypothetical protein [Spiroplasma endosymbiont of Labia minor]|uniref:hypothetical protein n=1 Tax=Spiroplasma endosymbiont of Labia minor TaxID=3066305 RepID=UPI0030D5591D